MPGVIFKLEASFLAQMACIGPLNTPGVVGKLVFDITQLQEHPKDGSDDDLAVMDEEDTGSEKVMVEKADLADGLLLELEEERSRS